MPSPHHLHSSHPHSHSQPPPKPKQRSPTLISLVSSASSSSSSSSSSSPRSSTVPSPGSSIKHSPQPDSSATRPAAPIEQLTPTITTCPTPITPHRNSLQLLNPSASPYVSLTPGLVSPERDQCPSHFTRQFGPISSPFTLSHLSSPAPSSFSLQASSNLRSSPKPIPTPRNSSSPSATCLATSQHTLRTLAGGRYYDEYDEDDDTTASNQAPPLPTRTPSPNSQPHLHQASFPPSSSSAPSYLARSHVHPAKTHIVDLSPSSHCPSAQQKTTQRHLSIAVPQVERPYARLPSPSTSHSDRKSRSFNLFSLQDWHQLSEERPLLGFCLRLVGLIIGCGLIVAGLVWVLLPPVDEKDLHILRIPTSFEALKKLNALLQIYKTENYYRVLTSFVLIYLFLQAFSLPGSMYLSILAGAMFGVQVALPLVCLCVATGAMLCYMMSCTLASTLVLQLPSLRNRLSEWKMKISTKTNKFDLFAYLVVVRISPLPPHWAVNLLAPHVGIPLGMFWLTTCLGILPVTLIHTQLGTTLDQMVGPEDLSFMNTKNLTGLGLVAVGVMLPVLIRWYFKNDSQDLTCPSTTVESRPFSARIGLSLDDDEEYLGRPNRLRSLSGNTYERIPTNSSITSLSKLSRIDSNETLLLSSSHLGGNHPSSLSGRLSECPITVTTRREQPLSDKPTRKVHHHHHIESNRSRIIKEVTSGEEEAHGAQESLVEEELEIRKKSVGNRQSFNRYPSHKSMSDINQSTPRPSMPF